MWRFPQISGPTTSWNLVELLDAHINSLYINVWQELFGQVVCIVVLILSSCEWLIWGKISYYIVSWVRLSLGIHCCMINSCEVGLLERNIHIYIYKLGHDMQLCENNCFKGFSKIVLQHPSCYYKIWIKVVLNTPAGCTLYTIAILLPKTCLE